MFDPDLPPGAMRDPDLHASLIAAFEAMGPGYVARTHLMDAGVPRFVNRLILEPSPYLLQHAHNPVDWWAWGDAALAEAARRDVPIFLSAGYATCHWCHVMDEESFDNVEVAQVLNAHFVAVKLDREQRPDIDHLYITATSLQQRQAGWPNSVWMLADGKPFHTGTYFPKPHFMQVLRAIAQGWKSGDRSEFERVAGVMAEQLQKVSSRMAAEASLAEVPAAALRQLAGYFNPEFGGFSTGTQFPHEGHLLFLLDHWRRTGKASALEMARKTLDEIAAGGIHDHVGGGFHRYSVDVNWRTPHFEKMLYNQALLLRCYTEIYEITGEDVYARAAERCIGYVLRDMAAEDGAFFAAEDADSLDAAGERSEGAFYIWTAGQLREVPGAEAEDVITALNVDATPTLEEGPVAHLTPGTDQDFAALDPMFDRLRVARQDRPRPFRDEKVIAGWNGLMIRAMAEAAARFGREDWMSAAGRAAEAVFARLEGPNGLARLHAGGRALEQANLSDYVWLAQGCLALGERWWPRAEQLANAAYERFATEGGRLALTRDGAPLGPVLEGEDGAVPSGESSALELFAQLDARMPGAGWKEKAADLQAAISGGVAGLPMVRLQALIGAEVLGKGEAGFARYLADGALHCDLQRADEGWQLHLKTSAGWHIANGRDGPAPHLEGAEAAFPKDDLIAGKLVLDLVPHKKVISLRLQICNDSLCLEPLTVTYHLP